MRKVLFYPFLFFLYFSSTAQVVIVDSVITKNAMFEVVSILSSDKMNGRNTGTKEIDSVAQYIAKKFYEAGLYPAAGNNNYFQDFRIIINNGEIKATNVMGVIPAKDTIQDSLIIFSAHYDHIGNGNFGVIKTDLADTIYNGANDNTTGVAALVEIAKFYTLLNENKYTILFIAFSGEEIGLLGSQYEANVLNTGLIKAVINIDMIGRPIGKRVEKCMVISKNSSSILKQLNKKLKASKPFFIDDQYPLEYLNVRADHASFVRCKNAFSLICTPPNDKFYHSPFDSIDTINFPFLLKTTINIAEACRIFIK